VPVEVAAGYDALRQGDYASARRSYQAAIASDPRNVDAHLGLATIGARDNNRVTAAEHYRRVLDADPRNATAIARLAALTDSARPEALEAQLQADIVRIPAARRCTFTLGNLYASQSRWSEAQAAYFEAHRLDPGSADIAYNLAVSLDQLGQRRVAAEFYGRGAGGRARPLARSSTHPRRAPARRSCADGLGPAAPLAQVPLGQTLLSKGIISQDQLNIALTEQKRFKSPLGKVLVTLGFVTEATIRDILSETLGRSRCDLENTIVDPAAIALVPKDMARRFHVLPVSYDAGQALC
jgi:tetratricopeptide (TPR) repeat protein